MKSDSTGTGWEAINQSNPQYTFLSACQGPLVSNVARAWPG